MKYDLIAIDMDGTLLNSHHEVSERTKNVLKQAVEQGTKVVLSTGRIYTSAQVYGKLLDLNTPIIACNGAIIRDRLTNEVLYQNPIDTEAAIKVFEICHKKDQYFHFYDHEKFFVEKKWQHLLEEYYFNRQEKNEIEFVSIEDSVELLRKQDVGLLKIVMINEESGALDEIKPRLLDIPQIGIDKSWYNNMEVMAEGVSKGAALKRLSELYQIPSERIIAFGDNYNDLSMAQYAGTFVAMGNSDDAIKKSATYVTATNNEEGVALGIEKYVLS